MLYDFDTLPNRRGTSCVKWDEAADGVLPLWVADMDFATAPCIQEAVRRRAQHPVYGYTFPPDAYYDAIIDWHRRRHGWHIERHQILYTIGVVPALAAILGALTMQGDGVVLLTPVYNCFFSCIRNAGCQLVDVPLLSSPTEADAAMLHFDIDWQGLEAALAQEKTSVLLLCNPQNPAGRIWTADELRRIGDMCRQHGVTVVSDEIHGELTRPGLQYTPWGTIGEEYQQMAVIATAPSKAFNFAGLQNAQIIIANGKMRRQINRQINIYETCDVNPFGIEALMAAYSAEGEAWFDALRDYIYANYDFAVQYVRQHLPMVRIADTQATYLMWLDVRQTARYQALSGQADATAALDRQLQQQAGVWFNAGNIYGPEGEGWLRINLATSRAILTEALRRFVGFLTSQP